MSKFSCFLFGNPTNKTVRGTSYMCGLLIANHLDQSLWSTNQKYSAAGRSNSLHSFLEVHNCVAPFTSHGKLHKFGAEKPISWAKQAHFDLFTMNSTVWSHILSTVGYAVSGTSPKLKTRNHHSTTQQQYTRYQKSGIMNVCLLVLPTKARILCLDSL